MEVHRALSKPFMKLELFVDDVLVGIKNCMPWLCHNFNIYVIQYDHGRLKFGWKTTLRGEGHWQKS
jgi:hypothetical protein